MIDIHCHILPNVDDGAKHMEDSVAMAKEAASQGIHTMLATPHHKNGRYDNPKDSIIQGVAELNKRLEAEGIPVTILPGQEIRIYGEMIEDLNHNELLPINETSRYVLVELPTNHVPRFTAQLLFDLQVQEITPIIVHPERNTQLLEHPNMLYDFVRNGALTQITAASLVGKFGKKIKKFSHDLIEANLTHFVASDTHNTTSRRSYMQEATKEIKQIYGTGTVYYLMENAQLLIEGQTVFAEEPTRIKQKKFLGLF
ncbi:protein-tyrosine phosphatase [Natronobacillus azotifigens]|uniref:Tyrosine-protein phosphatase n=1 Tax=Natronobacillus azotifigens TaxID=472978 RepID=A0A9J6RCF9_9BACI|nr:CpsB/CapC family capsule biosynthesis tyrosine phosphatase [Natronobacillus azotifigens]MCZ0702988.1 tyrosine protein phosphatase [Natronobacillus azotifigens]